MSEQTRPTAPAPIAAGLVAPKPAPPREAVRGASAQTLSSPAGLYLASLRWDGAPGDPDTLSAASFLARL